MPYEQARLQAETYDSSTEFRQPLFYWKHLWEQGEVRTLETFSINTNGLHEIRTRVSNCPEHQFYD
jgi:hypothetical protein